jgi:hypothetical protein
VFVQLVIGAVLELELLPVELDRHRLGALGDHHLRHGNRWGGSDRIVTRLAVGGRITGGE